jgi:hypothetical protein
MFRGSVDSVEDIKPLAKKTNARMSRITQNGNHPKNTQSYI